jgi:hypothetical protein
MSPIGDAWNVRTTLKRSRQVSWWSPLVVVGVGVGGVWVFVGVGVVGSCVREWGVVGV